MTVSATDKQSFPVRSAIDDYVDNNFVGKLVIVFVVPPDIFPHFHFPTHLTDLNPDEFSLAKLSLKM